MVHAIGWMYWKCLGVNDICTVNLLHPMAFLLNERGKGGEMAEGGSPSFWQLHSASLHCSIIAPVAALSI